MKMTKAFDLWWYAVVSLNVCLMVAVRDTVNPLPVILVGVLGVGWVAVFTFVTEAAAYDCLDYLDRSNVKASNTARGVYTSFSWGVYSTFNASSKVGYDYFDSVCNVVSGFFIVCAVALGAWLILRSIVKILEWKMAKIRRSV